MTLPSFDHTRELMLSVTYISVQPFIFMRTLQLVTRGSQPRHYRHLGSEDVCCGGCLVL